MLLDLNDLGPSHLQSIVYIFRHDSDTLTSAILPIWTEKIGRHDMLLLTSQGLGNFPSRIGVITPNSRLPLSLLRRTSASPLSGGRVTWAYVA